MTVSRMAQSHSTVRSRKTVISVTCPPRYRPGGELTGNPTFQTTREDHFRIADNPLRTRLRSLNFFRSLFETIDLKKVCDDCQELFRFLDIHDMANIGNHDSARVGNGGLDGSRVRVDVRDVGIADQDERWHMNL